MTIAADIEEMHGVARVQIALAKLSGFDIDKKVARYNDIVRCAARYALCGGRWRRDVAFNGLRDAIDCCVKGDPMHTGETAMTLVPDWMLTPQARAIYARHFAAIGK